MQESLWEEGWTNITNVDWSERVVQDMSAQCTAVFPGLRFLRMDCRNMKQFPDKSFDLVVEKGMVDCLFTSLQPRRDAATALAEISRVLEPGGSFVSVSCAPRAARLSLYAQPCFGWNVQALKVPLEELNFTLLTCDKNKPL